MSLKAPEGSLGTALATTYIGILGSPLEYHKQRELKMTEMLSLLDAQLCRTWTYHTATRTHTITLFHDTLTGARSAIHNFVEIENSLGHSTLFMDKSGHEIPFDIEGHLTRGKIVIKKNGYFSFAYSCIVNDEVIAENTQQVSERSEQVFRTRLVSTEVTPDDDAVGSIVWYLVETRRLRDQRETLVHRRFRDFADLHEQVRHNLKGHHLYSSIPALPPRPLKITNGAKHLEPSFISGRLQALDLYVSALIALPHVSEMTCTKAFLGLMESVREYSVVFHQQQLGLTLLRAPVSTSVLSEAAVVGSIQSGEHGHEQTATAGLTVGDSVSKINGTHLADLNFNGTVARIRRLPRPVTVHFIQIMRGPACASAAGHPGHEAGHARHTAPTEA